MTNGAARITGGQSSPVAPGGLGQAVPAQDLRVYLERLTAWTADRRTELDRLDAAAQRATDADSYTADLALAMTVWQSIKDRLDRLVATWDSGRAERQAREEMSRLIWGRMDTGTGIAATGLGVSLVEAGRLSDALVAALRARLAFDPLAADVAARVAAVRAGLARCLEMVARGGSADPGIDVLRRRLEELAAKAAQGADVTGPLSALEVAAAGAERDLIVAAAGRRNLTADAAAARARRAELERRAQAVRAVAERCREKIAGPPRLGVPDVDALGPVPSGRTELDAYRARLQTVAAALNVAEAAYTGPLDERDQLRGLLQAYRGKAVALGRTEDAAVRAGYDAARVVLWSAPCRLDEARRLVTEYQRLLTDPTSGPTDRVRD